MKTKLPALVRTVRWIARIMSIILIGIYFIEILRTVSQGTFEIFDTFNIVVLSLIGVGFIGLGLAWRWEAAGGITALLAYTALALTNWNILKTPMALYPINAVIFLLAWILKLRFIRLQKSLHSE